VVPAGTPSASGSGAVTFAQAASSPAAAATAAAEAAATAEAAAAAAGLPPPGEISPLESASSLARVPHSKASQKTRPLSNSVTYAGTTLHGAQLGGESIP